MAAPSPASPAMAPIAAPAAPLIADPSALVSTFLLLLLEDLKGLFLFVL